MNNHNIFDRYELQSIAFSLEIFNTELGNRLVSSGLHKVAKDLAEQGSLRRFLKSELTEDEKRKVNLTEGVSSAKEAEVFQNRLQLIEVRESGESLKNLRQTAIKNDLPWTFTNTTYHEACGDWAGKERLFWARSSVEESLVYLTEPLSAIGFGVHFEDGFRPLGVQEGLFKRRYEMASNENPEWTHEQWQLEAKAKTAYTPRFAAHKAAAAVDIRLKDMRSGKLLDIGHDYPDGGALVALDAALVTQRQWQNRHLLAVLAIESGLTMYPFEDWHVSIGDVTAAACTNPAQPPTAIYGPVKRFDEITGEILEIYEPEELDVMFEVKS